MLSNFEDQLRKNEFEWAAKTEITKVDIPAVGEAYKLYLCTIYKLVSITRAALAPKAHIQTISYSIWKLKKGSPNYGL